MPNSCRVPFRASVSCPLIVGALLALVGAAPARGQQCLEFFGAPGAPPLPGVSNFQLSTTITWSGRQTCIIPPPEVPPPCSSTCSLSSSELSGHFGMYFCPLWRIPRNGDPGYWCWSNGITAAGWGGLGVGTGMGQVYFFPSNGQPGGVYSMQGQSTMQFNSATRLTLNPGTSQALTGGTRLSTYSVVYFRAGETVVFTCWASDVGNGTSPGYTYEPCPDVDSNGTCDDYDAAARAFGDFDSSGSIGLPPDS